MNLFLYLFYWFICIAVISSWIMFVQQTFFPIFVFVLEIDLSLYSCPMSFYQFSIKFVWISFHYLYFLEMFVRDWCYSFLSYIKMFTVSFARIWNSFARFLITDTIHLININARVCILC